METQDLNSDEYGEAPEGVSPDLWEEMKRWHMRPSTDFLYQMKRGQQGKNIGLATGSKNLDKHIHGVHQARYYLIGADAKVGKCLGKGTKVIMFDGTLKSVEDLNIGEQLMGPDGTPRNILSTCTGKEQMYWVRQKRGIDYRVNESHILSLVHKPQNRWSTTIIKGQETIEKNKRKRQYTLEKTFELEVKNFSVKEYLDVPNKLLYQGWKSPQGFDHSKNLLHLDPYFLGLWLGDGTTDAVEITNVEPEILYYLYSIPDITVIQKDKVTVRLSTKKVLDQIDPNSMEVVNSFNSVRVAGMKFNIKDEYISRATKTSKIVAGYIWKWRVRYNHLREGLKLYNLLGNKHIPHSYMCGSCNQKLAMIAGLIDSDGYFNPVNGMVEIVQKRKELAEQIVFVIRSLGFYAGINEKTATMKRLDGSVYKCQVFRITFSHCASIPCKVKRKISERYNAIPLTTGIKVEKDIVDDYYGFTIDGDSLFLLEDFTVTHNTTVADCLFIINAWRDAKLKGKPIKIFYCSFEIGKLDKMSRWVSHWVFILFGKRFSSDYILGREEDKMLTKEDEILVLQGYAKVMEMMQDMKFIEDTLHPTKIFEDLIEAHYEKVGNVLRTELTEEQKKKHKKGYVKGFEAHDPDLITMLVIDHLALTGTEMGLDTKHIMDKMSKYAVVLRNIFRTTCVFIQQFSPDLMSLMRAPGKKSENSITPQRLDFGDSKATYRDADVIIGLVKPVNYDFKEYKGYILMSEDAFDSAALGSNFLVCFLIGNRYGNSDRMLPFFVDYLTGTVYDLPLQPHNVLAMEPWYRKAKELKNDLNK